MFVFQPSFQPFDYGAVPPTPIYNIQQGANGELYAEPDPSMSFHPSQVRVTRVGMDIREILSFAGRRRLCGFGIHS